MRHAQLIPWFAALLFGACDESRAAHDDLPSGWQDARQLTEFTQGACVGSPSPDDPEALAWSASDGQLELSYHRAHFRCAQDVEAFIRRQNKALDILVQPVDMNPNTIAKCDCSYELWLRAQVPPGTYTLTLYRRWDNLNADNVPVEIGSERVTVP